MRVRSLLNRCRHVVASTGRPIATASLVAACIAALGARTSAQNLAYGGTPAAIPGQINGENFDAGASGVSYYDTTSGNYGGQYRSTDVDIETSSEGGYDIGWTAAGEWLNYTVNVASAGTYTVQLRVASPYGGSIHVGFNTASNVWQAVSVPATGGWQNWTNVSFTANLGAGVQQMTLLFDTGKTNYRYATVTGANSGSASSGSGPYGGTPAAVPGTVLAANFDSGGEGVAYHDTTPGNAGGQYRSTNVDIETASDGGYDVGWIAAGEWLNYTVNVGQAGTYTAALRVSSPYGGYLHVGFNQASNVWTSVSVPATGGWQNWTTVNVPVTLGAGTQQMTLMFDTSGMNLESIAIASSGSGSGSGGGGGGGGGATLNAVDWNVQVDDSSASHAQTVMDYLAGMSPLPQVIVIEEAHQSQYNTYINELQNRTGQSWQGVMQTHCPPGAWNGSSCTGSEDEGVAVFTSLPVVDRGTAFLPYPDAYHSARAIVRLAVNFNGMTMQVWGTHLQVNNATSRNQSMALIKTWLPNYGAPQIFAGDLNAGMDQIDVSTGLYPNLTDSWALVGSGNGYTASTPSPTMKLDFWLSDSSLRAQPVWTQVNTSTGTISDHFPVQTTFVVR